MQLSEIHRLLDEALKTRGAEQVVAALERLVTPGTPEPGVLTIVANTGIHEIPPEYLRGEIYEASHGNWDASTEEALLLELNRILSRLVSKLRSGHWNRVYLIPTGHPILSLQIKALVYRLLRFNTVDLYHNAGTYFEVDIDQRALALDVADRA